MPNLGEISNLLGTSLLAGAGPEGRAAATSLLNNQRELAYKKQEDEAARLQQESQDRVALGQKHINLAVEAIKQSNDPNVVGELTKYVKTVADSSGIPLPQGYEQPLMGLAGTGIPVTKVDTVENGRDVTKLVPNREGQTFASQEKVSPISLSLGGQTGPLITLDVPNEGGGVTPVTLRRDDPRVNQLTDKGATEQGATALSTTEVKYLNDIGQRYQSYNNVYDSFKPEFANTFPYVTEVGNVVGNKTDMFGTGEQADWWKNYQSIRNEVRNSLFGGALTPTEAEEFLKADITEGMSDKRIEKNLQRQHEILSKAVLRASDPLMQAGKNKSQINSAIGSDVAGRKYYKVGATVTENGKKFKVTRAGFDPDVEEIE